MAIATALSAQGLAWPTAPRVGDEEERYLRALSRLAADSRVIWSIRPLGRAHALPEQPPDGPWKADSLALAWRGIGWGGAFAEVNHNSGLPLTHADGPAWGGRGMNVRASVAGDLERGPLRVRIAPVAWFAQNAPFRLAPTSGPFPWSDAARPISIDLPQRHGSGALARLDAGDSEVEVASRHLRVALTSSAAHIGPGGDHAIVLNGASGGFPRLEAGTVNGIRTRAGTVAALVGWGRQPQTAWAPERRDGGLYGSFMALVWKPPIVQERLEAGFVRFFGRDWGGLRARDLLVPFGSVHSSNLIGGDSAADNQLASVFVRLTVAEAGLEFFGEFAKNDRSIDLRDQAVELEHNAAWLLGASRSWRREDGRLWSMSLTAASAAISPITRFRDQAFFYEHYPLSQGHTARGQSLGTPLLEREGGGELRLDRYDAAGRTGLILRTRSLPNERAEYVPAHSIRQEWLLLYERMRFTRIGATTFRAGGVADLGHSPGRDAYSLHVSLGIAAR